jgi:hypothetical protein
MVGRTRQSHNGRLQPVSESAQLGTNDGTVESKLAMGVCRCDVRSEPMGVVEGGLWLPWGRPIGFIGSSCGRLIGRMTRERFEPASESAKLKSE